MLLCAQSAVNRHSTPPCFFLQQVREKVWGLADSSAWYSEGPTVRADSNDEGAICPNRPRSASTLAQYFGEFIENSTRTGLIRSHRGLFDLSEVGPVTCSDARKRSLTHAIAADQDKSRFGAALLGSFRTRNSSLRKALLNASAPGLRSRRGNCR